MSFRIRGLEIYISFFFISVITLMLLMDLNTLVYMSLVGAAMHELGHILMMCLLKSRPVLLEIKIFGARLVFDESVSISVKNEILTALAGPAVSLILGFIMLLLFYFSAENESLLYCSYVNFALAFFNLLPVADLDGGRMLYYSLLYFFNERLAGRICLIVSVFLLLPLGFLSFAFLLKGNFNISVFIVYFYLVFLIIQKNLR